MRNSLFRLRLPFCDKKLSLFLSLCLTQPDLRHSHAALLVDLGYSIVAVAERLGDTVEVAMATYSHLYPEKMDSMVADLERRAAGTNVSVSPGPSLGELAVRLEEAEKGAPKK